MTRVVVGVTGSDTFDGIDRAPKRCMMKRKPLQLKAETVRVLASRELTSVNGGAGYAVKTGQCQIGGGGGANGTGSSEESIATVEREFVLRVGG
jgi:hypothetical protein